jgi:acetyl-CoA synthetase
LFTADEGKRGGKVVKLKEVVDAALQGVTPVQTVLVFKRTGAEVPMTANRDLWMQDLLPRVRPFCPSEPVDSEETLFILYTSGSTGKPKGVAHTTAGYLLNAALTTQTTFDLEEGDVYCCVADCGWITGHTVCRRLPSTLTFRSVTVACDSTSSTAPYAPAPPR